MTIDFLKSGNPAGISIATLVAGLLRLSFFVTDYPAYDFDAQMPLFTFLIEPVAHTGFLLALFAFLLVVFQAYLFNKIVEEQKLLRRFTYLPYTCYLLVFTILPQTLFVTPALISLSFILPVLRIIFNMPAAPNIIKSAFNAGLLVGIGGMFHAESLIFLLMIPTAAVYFYPSKPRVYIAPFVAVVIPFYLHLAVKYILYGTGINLPPVFEFYAGYKDLNPANGFIAAQIAVLAGISLPSVLKGVSVNTVKVKQCYQLIVYFGGFGLLTAVLFSNTLMSNLVFALTLLSLMLTNLLFYAKKAVFANVLLYLIVVLSAVNLWVL